MKKVVKSTKELYDLDPKMFKRMYYEDVLNMKHLHAKMRHDKAVELSHEIGYINLTDSQKEEVQRLASVIRECKKAMAVCEQWLDELK